MKPAHLLVRSDLHQSIPFADDTFHCVVTSPPYWALRDYKSRGQLGLEKTPSEYIDNQVRVFREVRRVLRNDGSLYLNIGDTFYSGKGAACGIDRKNSARRFGIRPNDRIILGFKPKDLVGIPWMLAFALRDDGWYLRCDNIWNCVNKMPESVRDRSSRSHEYVFHLTKTRRYYYDEVAERKIVDDEYAGALRSVWDFPTGRYGGSHFAVMPISLAARCVRLGSSSRGCCSVCGAPYVQDIRRTRVSTRPGYITKVDAPGADESANRDPQRHATKIEVLGWLPSCECPDRTIEPCKIFDPYGGAWTTVLAANQLGRHGFATELSSEYFDLARERLDPFRPQPSTIQSPNYADPDEEFDF